MSALGTGLFCDDLAENIRAGYNEYSVFFVEIEILLLGIGKKQNHYKEKPPY